MATAWRATAIALLSVLILASCSAPAGDTSPPTGQPPGSVFIGLPHGQSGRPDQSESGGSGTGNTHGELAPPSSPRRASSSPRPTLPDLDTKLQAYAADCERTVGKFKSGQVDYPRRLSLAVSQSITYVAAVDIRTAPAPPSQVIGHDSATDEAVTVRCVVGTRLTPVGGGIDVATSDATDDGWRYQEFTPSGLLKFAWTITGRAPFDQQVRLEVRPAVKGQDVGTVGASDTVPFVTDVHVSADWVQKLSYWFQTEWPLIVGIATPIGVALGALFTFSEKARDSFATLFRRRRRPAGRSRTTANGRRGPTGNNEVKSSDKGTRLSARQSVKAPAAHAPPKTNRRK
jgi:hypothetical protein